MIIPILAVGAMICAPTKIVNKTDTWTKFDQKVLDFNKDFCKTRGSKLGCMKMFRKNAERNHSIVCIKGVRDETILERIKLRTR